MHPVRAILTAVLLALLLGACGGATPQSTLKSIAYGDPAKDYLGMTKAEVIACAGEPHSTYKSGAAAETLTYHYSGAGPVPGEAPKADEKKKKPGFFGGDKKKEAKDWTCSASLVFENDRLARVTFSHKDVHSPYDWQSEKDPKKAEAMRQEEVPTCPFSLPRCPR
jgi:hypothetical protein